MSPTVTPLRRPRVGLIATLLSTAASYRGAGIHTYSQQLLHHLPQQAPSCDYLAFVNDPAYSPSPPLLLHRAPITSQRPARRILWEQTALPLAAYRQHLDLWHSLAYALPLATTLPSVVTVHDLTFLLFPRAFAPANRLYLSSITALSCRRARRVIAVSQATARDLERRLHIPADRIDVIYNGVDDALHPRPAAAVAAHRQQAGWPEHFILSIGTLEPRKNYPALLTAYALYRRLTPHPLPLIIGGGKGWRYETVFAHVAELDLQNHVSFLGFVPAEILPWLYCAADLFVYPSLYEGFGLPVAEAMACGVPAITSTASSLPEVAGSAALTLPPDDIEALARAMITILDDPDRQTAMRTAGFAQSRRFRWQQTAADTAAVYQRALNKQHG